MPITATGTRRASPRVNLHRDRCLPQGRASVGLTHTKPGRPQRALCQLAELRVDVWVSGGDELPNRDLLAVRPSLPEIVLHLLLQPAFRAAAEAL